MQIQSYQGPPSRPIQTRDSAPPPESPEPDEGLGFDSLSLSAVVVGGAVTGLCAGLGAGFGWTGAAATTAAAAGGGYLLGKGLDSGPRSAATMGLAVLAGASSAAGAAFGVPGVIGATLAGAAFSYWADR